MNNLSTGQKGEDLAVNLLQSKGYEIQCRNFRSGKAEIDIIARKDNTLVFVEVKSRKSIKFGFPETAVNQKKANLILQAANNYILDIDWNKNIRFDIIAILWEKEPLIDHFEDAFY